MNCLLRSWLNVELIGFIDNDTYNGRDLVIHLRAPGQLKRPVTKTGVINLTNSWLIRMLTIVFNKLLVRQVVSSLLHMHFVASPGADAVVQIALTMFLRKFS